MRKTQPPAIHTAFNPVIITYENNQQKQAETATITIGENSYSLVSEYFNGKAEIDISQFCKSGFSDVITKKVDSVYFYNRLFFKYTYTDDYGTFDAIAVNAASQWGESINLEPSQYTFRTGFKRLRKYKGYELTASSVGGDMIYVRFSETMARPISPDITLYTIKVPDNIKQLVLQYKGSWNALTNKSKETITNSNGDPIFIFSEEDKYGIMPIVQKDVPAHPFYVRWINRFGGYDYWMMECVQYHTLSAKMGDVIEKFYNDTEKMNGGNKLTLSKEATKIVKVSTCQCAIDDIVELQYLPLSPLVELYDEKRDVWVNLQCTDSETEIYNSQVSGSIEFEFELPSPRLQF